MQFGSHSINGKANRSAVVALSLLLAVAAACPMSVAQDASTLGAEQDSLLPPEVVPLDPSSNSMQAAAQSAKRQTETTAAGDAAGIPGMVNTPQSQFVSAQDMRKQAFEALYNNAPAQQPQQQDQPLQQWRAGQVMPSQNNGPISAPNTMPGNGSIPGMTPMASANAAPNSAFMAPPYSSPTMLGASAGQSQTLSGGSKFQPKLRDTRRGGFTNGLATAASLGASALMYGSMMHQSNPMMGLGMFGLTMTGFGVRNAFRF